MTEANSSASQLSFAMTSTGMTFTRGYTVSSSPPRGIEFYFQFAVLAIGVIGTAANALVLYALVASKQHKKNALIVHQNAIELFTSFCMIVIYITRLCNIHLTGSVGYWLCAVILSECLSWCGTQASAVNLAFITVERYLKVVHPAWSQNKLHNWMIYSAMATAWIIAVVNSVAGCSKQVVSFTESAMGMPSGRIKRPVSFTSFGTFWLSMSLSSLPSSSVTGAFCLSSVVKRE